MQKSSCGRPRGDACDCPVLRGATLAISHRKGGRTGFATRFQGVGPSRQQTSSRSGYRRTWQPPETTASVPKQPCIYSARPGKIKGSRPAARQATRTMPASPLHRVVSPCDGTMGRIPHGFQSKSRRTLHHARSRARDDAILRGPTKAFRSASNTATDAAAPEAVADSHDPLNAEAHPARPGSAARNADLLDTSSISAAASVQVIEGFLDQPIKPTCSIIRCDLLIPRSRIKLCEPSTKGRHLIRRQLLNRGFDFFDGTHGRSYTSRVRCRQRLFSGLTLAISGSRPSANHTTGFYRESTPSRGSPCNR
jgi:hypothetical protein